MRVAALNVSSGVVYVAVAEPSDSLLAQHITTGAARIQPSRIQGRAQRAAELYGRVRQELRVMAPDQVGVLDTRLYGNWKYTSAYDRISILTVIQLICHELGLPYSDIKTETAGRATGVKPDRLEDVQAADFGFESQPLYWRVGRAHAFAATAALLQETA